MRYRVTYTTPDGTSQFTCTDAGEALSFAMNAVGDGRDEVWLADDEGHLFTPREFERFVDRYS